MKLTFRLSIAILAFAFGVSSTLFWLDWNRFPPQKAETYDSSRLPILALCEVANNPEIYDRKTVRISAKLRSDENGFRLSNINCYGEKKQVVVLFGNQYTRIMEKIRHELGTDIYDPWEPVEIIAVGEFRKVTPSGKSDQIPDTACLQFEIMSIETASPFR